MAMLASRSQVDYTSWADKGRVKALVADRLTVSDTYALVRDPEKYPDCRFRPRS
ncbi:MAG: hypothetical protein R3D30_07715 [Hyphomicrobiales bacterium]